MRCTAGPARGSRASRPPRTPKDWRGRSNGAARAVMRSLRRPTWEPTCTSFRCATYPAMSKVSAWSRSRPRRMACRRSLSKSAASPMPWSTQQRATGPRRRPRGLRRRGVELLVEERPTRPRGRSPSHGDSPGTVRPPNRRPWTPQRDHRTRARRGHAVHDLPSRDLKAKKIAQLLAVDPGGPRRRLLEVGTGTGGIARWFGESGPVHWDEVTLDVVDVRRVRDGYRFQTVSRVRAAVRGRKLRRRAHQPRDRTRRRRGRRSTRT